MIMLPFGHFYQDLKITFKISQLPRERYSLNYNGQVIWSDNNESKIYNEKNIQFST